MGKESVETFTWRSIKEGLARGVSFARANDMTEGIGGTTLQSAISEAILDLDSEVGDPVESMGATDSAVTQSEPVRSSYGKKGRIQQMQDLLRFYYGDGETKGFFDSLLDGMGPAPTVSSPTSPPEATTENLPAGVQITDSMLWSLLPYFYGWNYTKKGETSSYPWTLPGVPGLIISPPGPKQNNCSTFVEALIIGAAVHENPNFKWGLTWHNQMMILDPNDLFSPITALVASGLATPLVHATPFPWTMIQIWGKDFTGGHSCIIVDYHQETDKILLLESNLTSELNGVGWRGIGRLQENPHPTEWWNLKKVPTWAALTKKYPNLKGAVLRASLVEG